MKRTNSYKLETNKQTKEPSRKQNLNRLITSNESESEVAQSFLFLCNSMDCNLPGSSVHGILQARILEWVAISFSRGSSDPGIEPGSPTLQAHSLPTESPQKPSPCTGSKANRLEWKSWEHRVFY